MPTRSALVATLLVLAACVAHPARSAMRVDARDVPVFPAAGDDVLVMGRHVDSAGTVSFGAAGVTFFLRFAGTAAAASIVEQPGAPGGHDWLTVVVDGGEPTRVEVDAGRHVLPLAGALRPGVHTLALSKATEGQNGRERLIGFSVDRLLAPDPLPARRIEFIGNSITVGYGSDPRAVACGTGTWYDASHAWLAYGPRVARAVGAQWMLSAVSGIGMHRNWSSDGPAMPRVYDGVYMDYADTLTRWDATRYVPDLVVIALGTNDFSDGGGPTPRPALDEDAFVRDYEAFVARVRERHPRARLMLLTSPMLDAARNGRLAALLARVIADRAAAGDTAITRFSFGGRYTAGCDGHPALDEQRRMAEALLPAVRARMGW